VVGLLLELLDEFLDIERESLIDLTNRKLIHREGCGKVENGIGEFPVVQPWGEQSYRPYQKMQHGDAIPDRSNVCSGAASALIEADVYGTRLIWSVTWGIALNIALHLPDAPKIGRIDGGCRALTGELTGEPRKRIHHGNPFPPPPRRSDLICCTLETSAPSRAICVRDEISLRPFSLFHFPISSF
jgi:hypothetical protein